MAYIQVTEHPKFLQLMLLLNLNKFECLGALESTWHFNKRYTPGGNIGKFANAQIAAWIGWRRDPDELIDAEIETRWLDRSIEYRLVVHDWFDWADETVHAQLARQAQCFVYGQLPKTRRLNETDRNRFNEALTQNRIFLPNNKLRTAAAVAQLLAADLQPICSEAATPDLTLPNPEQETDDDHDDDDQTRPDTHRRAGARKASFGNDSAGADTRARARKSSSSSSSSFSSGKTSSGDDVCVSILRAWNDNCEPELKRVKDTPTRRNFLRICIKRHNLTPQMIFEALQYMKRFGGGNASRFDNLIQHDTIVRTLWAAERSMAKANGGKHANA